MNRWKTFGLAILFSFLSFGAIQETIVVFTSPEINKDGSKYFMIPFSVILTGVFVFYAIKNWRKLL
jgi:hypothetical protein